MKGGRAKIVSSEYLDGRASEASEIDLEEMREFMMGDLLPDLADPDFKSRLRQELWKRLKGRDADSSKKKP